MLVDQKETREIVRQIVLRLTPERGLHDDLTQEAIIHLWLRESQCPGQTQSWYFQSCRFHLQNLLRAGRSVDSMKRHESLCPLAAAYDCAGDTGDESAAGGSVPALVSAREAASLLARWLTTTEKRVLELLLDGHSIRDAAVRLRTSHTSVIRHRRNIARLAARLGIEPVAHPQPQPPRNGSAAAEARNKPPIEQADSGTSISVPTNAGQLAAVAPHRTTPAPGIKHLALVFLLGLTMTSTAAVTNWFAQVRAELPFAGPGPKNPYGRMVQGTNGEFYGTTYRGGSASKGTVFKINTAGSWTTLASFNAGMGENPLYGGLTLASDGNFYGNTYLGGASNLGTIFRITHAGVLTNLFSFRGTNGSYPNGWLTQAADGNFYGVTFGGGISNLGTIYRMTPAGAVTSLVSFRGTNGANPYAGLVFAEDGNLYGTTFNGGSNDLGAVFRVTTNGALTLLLSFSGTNGAIPGSGPRGALHRGGNGFLYGTTEAGGAADRGTIYRITTNGSFVSLQSFGFTNGAYPQSALVPGLDGKLYGTTYDGGSSSNGTVFRISLAGAFEPLVSLDITNGPGPIADLTLGSDGIFYGTTEYGGYDGVGAMFRLVASPTILAITPAGGNVTLSWTAFSNGLYRVEHRPTMNPTNWTTLSPDVAATGSIAFRSDAVTNSQRYYRVRLLP